MNNKIIRYLVYLEYQDIPASYNTALGKEALTWARITALKYKGILVAQYNDGAEIEIKNYAK